MNSQTLPHPIDGLRAVAADYDVLLCDVWGVIHNGREHFAPALDALIRFREGGGKVVLISNAPRPSQAVLSQLDSLGVPRTAWDAFVTSGDATRAELRRRAPGPVWALGPDRDMALYEGTGVAVTDGPDEAAFICCTGLYDDTTEGPQDYRETLSKAAARDLEMVCANPDRVVQRGDQLIYCAGSLADLYEALGGRVSMAGKPFGPIYDLAMKEAETLLGANADRSRVLCVGDGVVTDVMGANGQALDCLFVAAGIHGATAQGPDGRVDAEKAAELLRAETTYARYTMLDLAW
jgi:HAD superfamily hydrolase (TIGR01459 family)